MRTTGVLPPPGSLSGSSSAGKLLAQLRARVVYPGKEYTTADLNWARAVLLWVTSQGVSVTRAKASVSACGLMGENRLRSVVRVMRAWAQRGRLPESLKAPESTKGNREPKPRVFNPEMEKMALDFLREHAQRNEQATASGIAQFLAAETGNLVHKSTVFRWLLSRHFSFGPVGNSKGVKLGRTWEPENVLKAVRFVKILLDTSLPIFSVDETSVHRTYLPKFGWRARTDDPVFNAGFERSDLPTSLQQSMIIGGVSTVDGVGVQHVISRVYNKSDYHKSITGEDMADWALEAFAQLSEPHLIIVDNVGYHFVLMVPWWVFHDASPTQRRKNDWRYVIPASKLDQVEPLARAIIFYRLYNCTAKKPNSQGLNEGFMTRKPPNLATAARNLTKKHPSAKALKSLLAAVKVPYLKMIATHYGHEIVSNAPYRSDWQIVETYWAWVKTSIVKTHGWGDKRTSASQAQRIVRECFERYEQMDQSQLAKKFSSLHEEVRERVNQELPRLNSFMAAFPELFQNLSLSSDFF